MKAKKRGRPPLTAEEKARRLAETAAVSDTVEREERRAAETLQEVARNDALSRTIQGNDLGDLLRLVVEPDDRAHSRMRAKYLAVLLSDRFDLWSEMIDTGTRRELGRIAS